MDQNLQLNLGGVAGLLQYKDRQRSESRRGGGEGLIYFQVIETGEGGFVESLNFRQGLIQSFTVSAMTLIGLDIVSLRS